MEGIRIEQLRFDMGGFQAFVHLWEVRRNQSCNRGSSLLQRQGVRVAECRDKTFCPLSANSHDLREQGPPMFRQSYPFDSPVFLVLAARQHSRAMECVDRSTRSCNREANSCSEVVNREIGVCAFQLKQDAALRERQIQIGCRSHDLSLTAFEDGNEGLQQLFSESLVCESYMHKHIICTHAPNASKHALYSSNPTPGRTSLPLPPLVHIDSVSGNAHLRRKFRLRLAGRNALQEDNGLSRR